MEPSTWGLTAGPTISTRIRAQGRPTIIAAGEMLPARGQDAQARRSTSRIRPANGSTGSEDKWNESCNAPAVRLIGEAELLAHPLLLDAQLSPECPERQDYGQDTSPLRAGQRGANKRQQ